MTKLNYLALTVAIIAIGLSANGSPPGFAAVVTTPLGGEECDVYCHEDCEPGSHNALDLVSTPPNATRNGGVHLDGQCRSGSCATKHGPLCEEQTFAAADVEAVRLAILHEDAESIRAAVASDGSPFHLSADRRAIQIVDCTGQFVAHFPVPDRLFERILTD